MFFSIKYVPAGLQHPTMINRIAQPHTSLLK